MMRSSVNKKNIKKAKELDYTIIKKLKFDVITYEDMFYKVVDNAVLRNLNYKEQPVLFQSFVLKFKEVLMLSNIHFNQCKLVNIKLEISEYEEGPFVEVHKEITIISGNVKIVKVGNLPCKYAKISILKGSYIQDFTKLECYGLTTDNMEKIYNEDMIELLFLNPYKLLYNK